MTQSVPPDFVTPDLGGDYYAADWLSHFSCALIHKARNALCDASAPAEQRINRAETFLKQWMLHTDGRRQSTNLSLSSGPRSGLAGWQIRRLKAYVRENLANPIRNKDLAVVAQLSQHHFCRAFRISLAETPHTYITRMRVEQAELLLRTSSLPLCQIATDCGFSDQAHFNKLFRKWVGSSPGAWQRGQANGSPTVAAAVYGDWRRTAPTTAQSPAQFRDSLISQTATEANVAFP
jgi:AraC family transcriptional regulator